VNKKGEVAVEFSKPLIFPDSWQDEVKKDRLLVELRNRVGTEEEKYELARLKRKL
jgi:hypothetical protein